MDEEVKLLADAKKLSMTERVSHAQWKARNQAYIDMQTNIERSFNSDDPCLAEYGACTSNRRGLGQLSNLSLIHPAASLFPKAVADANAAAQDKALETLLVWLSKADEPLVTR